MMGLLKHALVTVTAFSLFGCATPDCAPSTDTACTERHAVYIPNPGSAGGHVEFVEGPCRCAPSPTSDSGHKQRETEDDDGR